MPVASISRVLPGATVPPKLRSTGTTSSLWPVSAPTRRTVPVRARAGTTTVAWVALLETLSTRRVTVPMRPVASAASNWTKVA